MSDYISREAAIAAVQPTNAPAINHVLAEMLNKVPAADVVEVVRCKDCFAYKKSIEFAEAANLNPDEFCGLLLIEMPQDGFCYYGKRRTEDG